MLCKSEDDDARGRALGRKREGSGQGKGGLTLGEEREDSSCLVLVMDTRIVGSTT